MAYTKTDFNNDSAPGINGNELNKLGTGIEDAHITADTNAINIANNTASIATKANKYFSNNFFTTTNVGNDYSITTGDNLSSLSAGDTFKVKINADSTGACTLNVDTIGAVNILKPNGEAVDELFQNGVYTITHNGTNFILPSSGLGSFYGDGSDGSLNTSGSVTLTSTLNGGVVVKQYSSITINAGHTLTVSNPCQGLILYSQGDVTISGTVDMSQKAGLAPNANIIPMLITKVKSDLSTKTLQKYFQLTTVLEKMVGGAGGNGGRGGTNTSKPNPGTGGTGGNGRINLGGLGGGGGGGGGLSDSPFIYKPGNGGSIEFADFGGGKASQYQVRFNGATAIMANAYSGNGGMGVGRMASGGGYYARVGEGGKCLGGGGGGSGNAYPSTSDQTSSAGGNGQYAGGFIMIIAKGNIIINSGASLKCNGGNGGSGSNGAPEYGGGGGGGAGGGVIALFHSGTLTNNGTLQVTGGSGGSGGTGTIENGLSGTSGSAGTTLTQQL